MNLSGEDKCGHGKRHDEECLACAALYKIELRTNVFVNAITNTAERLGLDPVAFAEACQDGLLLTACIESGYNHNTLLRSKLEAIKAKGGM